MSQTTPRRAVRLLDLAALILGYGLAGFLIRSFWPAGAAMTWVVDVVVAVFYLWLGFAMGGPLVLLLDRRPSLTANANATDPRYTWAETAWILIGMYWIGIAVFVAPTRQPVNALFGVFPILAAILLRVLAPVRPASPGQSPNWTHHAAIGLLVTWPVAWGAMIVLGKTLF